jgi:PAS domain S-box-containing protein
MWSTDDPILSIGAMACWSALILRGASIGAGNRRTLDNWARAAALAPPLIALAYALVLHAIRGEGAAGLLAGTAGAAALIVQGHASFRKQLRTEADLRAALSELRAQKEIANLLFEQSSPNVVLCDREMRIMAVSQRWRETIDHGYDSIGLTFYESLPWCPPHWKKAHREALAGKIVRAEEDKVVGADGTARYSRWEARPWRTARGDVGGVMIYGQDVTSLVAARQENQANLERLKHALETVGAAVIEIDLAAKTVIASQNVVDILGDEPSFEDMVSLQSRFIPAEDRDLVRTTMQAILADGERRIAEHRVRRPDGTICWVQTSGMRVSDQGRIVLLLSDTNARKTRESAFLEAMRQAEDMLCSKRAVAGLPPARANVRPATDDVPSSRDHIDELFGRLATLLRELDRRDRALVDMMHDLEDARAFAEAASQSKSQFLANMSHELRTPLNAVIGYAEILMEDLSASGQTESIEDALRIRKAGRHLLELINEILDLSKIEAGRFELRPQTTDLKAIMREVADVIKPAIETSGNVLIAPEPPPLTLMTDAMRLRQCLLNLLSNATKFTHGGEFGINVDVTPGEHGQMVRIQIRDTGIGMSPEQMAKLFQAFVQADTSATRRYGGTGLGLVITRRLARALGGDVEAASEYGVGSTFTLTIACDLEASLNHQTANDSGEIGSRLILVVDENAETLPAVRAATARCGFEVMGIERASDLAATARRMRPAFVVFGLDRPDDQAWDALLELSGNDLSDIGILVVAPETAAARLARTGALVHLARPLDSTILEEAFAQCAPIHFTGGSDRAHPSR